MWFSFWPTSTRDDRETFHYQIWRIQYGVDILFQYPNPKYTQQLSLANSKQQRIENNYIQPILFQSSLSHTYAAHLSLYILSAHPHSNPAMPLYLYTVQFKVNQEQNSYYLLNSKACRRASIKVVFNVNQDYKSCLLQNSNTIQLCCYSLPCIIERPKQTQF